MVPSEHGWTADFSAPALRASCEASLTRLATDRIDVWLLHNPSRGGPAARGDARARGGPRARRKDSRLGRLGVAARRSTGCPRCGRPGAVPALSPAGAAPGLGPRGGPACPPSRSVGALRPGARPAGRALVRSQALRARSTTEPIAGRARRSRNASSSSTNGASCSRAQCSPWPRQPSASCWPTTSCPRSCWERARRDRSMLDPDGRAGGTRPTCRRKISPVCGA